MTFKKDVKLDPGQVTDLRGQRRTGGRLPGFGLPGGFGRSGGPEGGGGGLPIPIGGGGIVGIIVLIVIVVAIIWMSGGLSGTAPQSDVNQPQGNPGVGADTLQQECQTGADANERLDCRIVGFVNSIQAYWQAEFAENGQTYTDANTTLFEGAVDTGCGQATSEVGPFYCPADQNVYIDLGFFDVLESQLGATNAPLSQAYVISHEYGHHVQNLLGTLSEAQSQVTGPSSPQVRVELQADCYAGAWAANAVDTGYIEPLTQSEIAVAIEAARAVGDDRIQRKADGQVSEERWTHGSSAQRENWFGVGYRTAEDAECDTFSVPAP